MVVNNNRKKFLFGRVYTIINDPDERKDETYITEREMENIYKDKCIFEINKNNYLNDYYVKASTKQTEYYLYNSTILDIEKIKDKDVAEFSSKEIRDLIDSIPTGSKGQQNRVYKFINQYCKWMVDQERINLNPCDSIDRKDFTVNTRALKNKIIGLDRFWKVADEMILCGCHVQLVLPLVLSRYGIYGKNGYDILHLKYDQIDTENKIVTLYYEDGTFKTTLPIDDRFINIVEKSKYEDEIDSKYKACYLNTGYVIRRSSLAGDNGDIETLPGLVRRGNLAYTYTEHPTVKFNNLVKSRKLDFLFNIREKRKINTEDVLNVMKIFDPKVSNGSYHSLVGDIEVLTGEKVLYKYDRGIKLIDNNSQEFVDKIIKDLNFEGYKVK